MKTTFFRYFLLVCALTVLLSVSAFAFDLQGGTIDVNSALNFRQAPRTDSNVISKLYEGDRVAVLDKTADFYKIAYNGTVGYASVDYIVLQPIMNIQAGYAKVTASSLCIRSAPGTENEKIGSIPNGATAKIIGINDGWFKVTYGSTKGYICPDYVNVVKTASSAPTRINTPTPPSVTPSSSGDDLRQQIVDYAKTFLGVPYVWGGTTPKGFDCSGLVKYVYNHFGISIERTSYYQYHSSVKKISKSQLKLGDLVFFTRSDTGNDVGHVGIYVGNGKFIHAPRSGKNVEYASLDDTYYRNAYVGSGTMFK